MDFVVDASVLLPLILSYGRGLRRVLERHVFHVLDLTPYEVCNGLWKVSVKLHRIEPVLAERLCALVSRLIAVHMRVHSMLELDAGSVMRIALEHGITVYDASYIELAREEGVPVATADSDILGVAPRLGVEAYDMDSFTKLLEEGGG